MGLGLEADVEAADVLQPDQRDAVVVARARERADLRDAAAIQDAGGALPAGMLGIADQGLAVDHEAGVEPADPADAADYLFPDLGHDLPEHWLSIQARALIEGETHKAAHTGLTEASSEEIGQCRATLTVARCKRRPSVHETERQSR